MKQNTGHFFPLRALVSEIISSSQPPLTCQTKSVPSFVSHQPIAHPPCPPPSLPSSSVPWQTAAQLKSHHFCVTWGPVRRNTEALGPWCLPRAGDCWQGLRVEDTTPSKLCSRDALNSTGCQVSLKPAAGVWLPSTVPEGQAAVVEVNI